MAPLAPTPTPSPTTVALVVSGQIIEHCGSEGGCAYYADLSNGEGQFASGEIGAPSSLPDRLPFGDYTLTFRSSLVGDVIVNGAPPDESPDASCHTTLEVVSGQERLTAVARFRANTCDIVVTVS